ncbi:CHRD domain-containing protein [Niabella ginsengisoli]|uniref:CHRD domain-containing protein n=1 Tax=Niabella ginsengisoli TaxID=522298 RepID=A0ABS9SLA3_9BACT|nr:CHRD domain-containing protein [Niabella ginsengisoli]MCH5599145.1 CHRD domain-containing protein [Niabella ginsengisoli]
MKKHLQNLSFVGLLLIFFSCGDSEFYSTTTTVKTWNLSLSGKNEIPASASNAATGTAMLSLLSDNSLKYEFNVTGLASGDALSNSHLHVGNAGSNGPVVLPITMTFTEGGTKGTITNLRKSLVDSLKSDENEIYFNVHSTMIPAGIVRAQLNTTVEFAMDVPLSSTNEVNPTTPIVPTASGTAILRMTGNKMLYSNVSVTGLAATDKLSMAHIHAGASGANGAVLIALAATETDFGITKTITLADDQYNKLKTDALYVNAHSTTYPAGVARGQIR